MNDAYKYTKEEVLKKLNTTEEGLSTSEVKIRSKYPKNEILSKKKDSLLEIILKSLKDKMIIILIIASLVSFILGQTLEGVVILIIIVINTVISVIEEEKALEAV